MASLLNLIDEGSYSNKDAVGLLLSLSKTTHTPGWGLFELTPRCTLSCKMCYVHLQEKQMYVDELSTSQWLDIIKDAYNAGLIKATLTGGECMLHPGFKDIYRFLHEHGVIISVFTNATLIDRDMVEFFQKYPPEVIQISIYGSSPEGYGNVCSNSRAFFAVDNALGMLREAGIRFILAVTISRYMLTDYYNIFRYCLSTGALKIIYNVNLFQPRSSTKKDILDSNLTVVEKQKVIETAKVLALEEEKHYESEAYKGIDDDIKLNKGMLPCKAGISNFSVSWDGKMQPCITLYGIISYSIKEYGFLGAWDKVNKWAISYVEPDKCQCCAFNSECNTCPAMNYLETGDFSIPSSTICDEVKMLSTRLN